MQARTNAPDPWAASQQTQRMDWSISASPFGGFTAVDARTKPAVRPSSELLIGAARIRAVRSQIEELRSRCAVHDDLTTDIEYFLSCKHPRNCRPMVLLLRAGSCLEAAVLLHEACFVWLGTGLCCGGDSAGDGLLISPAGCHELFLKRAIDELLKARSRFHTVRLRVKTMNSGALADGGALAISTRLVEHNVRHKLPLAASYADMMASFGLRTRRSLRTKRRQLEDALRPTFLPALSPEQAFDVMEYLRTKTSPSPKSIWYFKSRRHFLRSRDEAFSMALRAQDGTWLSFLTGWRRGGITHVDMQMNHSAFRRESISAVMRAFLLEHEINIGQREIVFVGGCSALLERYCSPEEPVADLLALRPSLRGWCLERAMEKLCDRHFAKFIYF
jgi:hypothetical protein